MNTKIEQFPAKNLCPVLSVAKDGTVLYSNEAGKPLLFEWGIEVGEKLPSSIGDVVQKAIFQNSPEKIEVKAGNIVYLVAPSASRLEEALSRERSLLESVTRATDFMLAFFDPQFNFVWVNPAYAKSCRMKPEELVGKNHFALYPHAENEAIFRKVRDTGEGVFYKDKPFVYPDQPERGVTYWDWSLAPVKNSSGNVTGLVLSLRETTKYKQADKKTT